MAPRVLLGQLTLSDPKAGAGTFLGVITVFELQNGFAQDPMISS